MSSRRARATAAALPSRPSWIATASQVPAPASTAMQRVEQLRLELRADAAHLRLARAEHVVEEVLRVADDRRTLGEELVRQLRERRVHGPGHRQDLATELRRLPDRVLGARAMGALDDHDEAGERGHDPVAGREEARIDLGARTAARR